MSKKSNHGKLLKGEKDNVIHVANHLSNNAENYLTKEMIGYIEHATDPKNNPVALRPAPSSQYAGLCQKLGVWCRGEVSVGTQGHGFMVVSPTNCAGLADCTMALYTGPSNTYGGVSAMPTSTVGHVGVYGQNVAGSNYFGSSLTGNIGQRYLSMVNACGVYIKPIGSATTQNGKIHLLEVPGHGQPGPGSVNTLSLAEVMQHQRTRVVDAVQMGTPGFQNVLNWHPQSGEGVNDNDFMAPNAISDSVTSELYIVITGDAGTKYEFEIYASYAVRGVGVSATTPMYTDPLGWAAYCNAISDKRLSGWIGSAGVATSIYKAFTARHVKRLDSKSDRELEDARAKLDREKAEKAGRSWTDTWKDIKPYAKELGGFVVNHLL